MGKRLKFYSTQRIDKEGAQYNMIIGERSNGKTYAVLNEKILKNYIETGKQGAYVRRWSKDLKRKRGKAIFHAIVANGLVEKYTEGKYTNVTYGAGGWYLSYYDEENRRNVLDDRPFCYSFSLSAQEHDKSASFPGITTICFDEFLTRGAYLPDEFVLFMNTISTIVRHRNDVTIYMLGNTVNKYSPYFGEMGLTHIREQKQGTIEVYTYGDSDLKVAVEYCSGIAKEGKSSDIYFAFDNPKLNMITSGVWELDIYPHCPVKYNRSNVIIDFFIEFGVELLHGEMVWIERDRTVLEFIYIHRKSTELKDIGNDILYTTRTLPNPNVSSNLLKPRNRVEKVIYDLFRNEKVFYQSNDVGEIVRNYLNWCGQRR